MRLGVSSSVGYHPLPSARPTPTIEVATEGAPMDSSDAPPTSEPSSEQPPAPSSDSPAPTPGKTKPANNEEAEDEEEAEEARRQRRSERWGIERVPTIKAKE